VSSNCGEVFLLLGITIMVHRVQSDLGVAGSFADFLHRSNSVFRTSSTSRAPIDHHHQKPHRQQHTHRKKSEQQYVSPGDIHLEENLQNGVVVKLSTETQAQARDDEEAGMLSNIKPTGSGAGSSDGTDTGRSSGSGSERDVKKALEKTALVTSHTKLDYRNDDGEPELHAL
jgi:hypothetical protein